MRHTIAHRVSNCRWIQNIYFLVSQSFFLRTPQMRGRQVNGSSSASISPGFSHSPAARMSALMWRLMLHPTRLLQAGFQRAEGCQRGAILLIVDVDSPWAMPVTVSRLFSCSQKMKLPPGLSRRWACLMTPLTSLTAHRDWTLTTVSMLPGDMPSVARMSVSSMPHATNLYLSARAGCFSSLAAMAVAKRELGSTP